MAAQGATASATVAEVTTQDPQQVRHCIKVSYIICEARQLCSECAVDYFLNT